ncbi:hypothetical protein BH11MYX3_BH11MYX3_39310 [soil metagenome]
MARQLLETLRMKILSSLAFSLFALSACATDGGFTDRASQVEGIYRVDSHLLNEASCSPGGAKVNDTDAFAFAKRSEVFGHELLQIYSCKSLADCRQKAAQKQLSGAIDFGFTLSDVDGEALTGTQATTGFTSGGGETCTRPELSSIVLDLEGDALHLTKSTRIGKDYRAEDGFCTTDKGRAATEDAPCSQMETLTATMLEAL